MWRAGGTSAVFAVSAALAAAACSKTPAPAPPPCSDSGRLVCTGLYGSAVDAGPGRIAPDVSFYEPGLRLWSDGLEKVRYVKLPPGSQIDTTDMDEWTFPVGTKLWKEFRWHGKRVETRYLEKTSPGAWRRTTFVWNADQSDAREATAGRTISLGEGHGPYDIPGQDDCGRCHGGRRDNVLGFEAFALAAPQAKGLTLPRLVAEGRLTRAPAPGAAIVPGGTVDVRALGWLHINCGVSCHNGNPEAGASFAGLDLKLAANGGADPLASPAVRTGVNQPTTALGFRDPNAPKMRIVPGRPGDSAIYFRASSRAPALSMPPLATHLVDDESVAALERWISALPAAGARPPPPLSGVGAVGGG
jgi:hypothetical protein